MTRLRRSACALALLAVAGCFLAPDDRVTGQWATRWLLIDADPPGVALKFPCMKAQAPELVFDDSKRFEGTASVMESFPGGPALLRLSGNVKGDQMTLLVTPVWVRWGEGRTDTYTLQRGAEPDFSGIGCLD